MIKSRMGHIQVNINPKNIAFYKELFTFLGWSVLYEDESMVGVGCEGGESVWFTPVTKEVKNDYDSIGMNHLGILASTQAGVDETVAYLKERGIQSLFETPRHRPEFSASPDDTYYQVMFESPDRVLLEVVYCGPKAK